MKFSANLGFLWADRTLPDAIRAAAAAGFDAVECHWPFDENVPAVKGALTATGLPMLGLNTRRGQPGENGLSALPGRGAEARAAVDEALAYAAATDTAAVHVMAGFAEGAAAHAAFVETLSYACAQAGERTILIEPLNGYDAPGYFLNRTGQAAEIIAEVGAPNLKLMFDCYHVQLTEGDVTHRLEKLLPVIGHVQVASVPDRGAPDHGELSFAHVWTTLNRLGWDQPVGAEYKPAGDTDATLGWLRDLR
jgi:hydroxypyruvate isomerase